jgi:hypothetical protein
MALRSSVASPKDAHQICGDPRENSSSGFHHHQSHHHAPASSFRSSSSAHVTLLQSPNFSVIENQILFPALQILGPLIFLVFQSNNKDVSGFL